MGWIVLAILLQPAVARLLDEIWPTLSVRQGRELLRLQGQLQESIDSKTELLESVSLNLTTPSVGVRGRQ
jgi:hypothetical protein